ncbi:IS66 family insertion sequence element accessory protein TnpB [Shewanella sp. Isolate7]|uniref:IS66 family insertion sequence element accessory protein TnpA n=1 Tax=Shewanella sp. Isolate7 TaxID=2908528 RepID=UPI001EFCF0E2|nr:IS66 family insertion sequence element accessory protein TnpB [Shewanella sp. Isolate7]MCG9721673.1 IS66 family insertion sequence element accessory protein TnpB [Shewanella sp. Isolate7]MCG9722411.1 IS66 family insertion sequence element accessory protein TnpB [Shewanella sp. Isolate7]MCG9723135.1 IS66 family insertion sequence element accessory protein TnpB [Shewanella sp. Isolate7]
MRHQRRDVNTWLDLFDRQEQSGLSAVAFCRQHQINIQTFYARRSDIRLQRTNNKFVHVKREVTTFESQVEDVTQTFVLKHASSALSVPADVNLHWLASLMKALNE